jgi:uncharacterized protein YoxC
MADLSGIARETEKLLSRIKRLELQIGSGTSRGDADIKDEIGEIRQQLRDIGWDEAKKKTTKKTTKVATAKHGGLAKRGYGVARRG